MCANPVKILPLEQFGVPPGAVRRLSRPLRRFNVWGSWCGILSSISGHHQTHLRCRLLEASGAHLRERLSHCCDIVEPAYTRQRDCSSDEC
mmetsp:Transcript_97446/g.280440  ORF Transcript_97446/g.280440 Transcript_97446/m.280440 type:complete len:91 (-) Transcript_97446:185-457(-)